jgi:hypothetical protein
MESVPMDLQKDLEGNGEKVGNARIGELHCEKMDLECKTILTT